MKATIKSFFWMGLTVVFVCSIIYCKGRKDGRDSFGSSTGSGNLHRSTSTITIAGFRSLDSGGSKVVSNGLTYVPQEGKVTITPKEKGKTLEEVVDVKVRHAGFCFVPGVHGSIQKELGFGLKLIYVQRHGLGVAGYSFIDSFSPDVGVWYSYRLDKTKVFKNLEAYAEYRPIFKRISGGLRLPL